MKRPLRRIIYLLIIFIWLLVMSFPVFAMILATQQQILIGNDPSRHVRIFLLQADNAAGVGFEWAGKLGTNASCTQTSVNYFLWEGSAESVSFCQCYDPLTGDALPQELSNCAK